MSPGEPFAPSWAILGPALRARKVAAHWRKTADEAWANSVCTKRLLNAGWAASAAGGASTTSA